MLSVSSRITKAAAYGLSGALSDPLSTSLSPAAAGRGDAIALRFNGKGTSTITGVGFELYQNVPNPWITKTNIGFHLPEATAATITVFDGTGRTIWSQTGVLRQRLQCLPDRPYIGGRRNQPVLQSFDGYG